ncbi:hypothetical protein [Cohnella fermenti]|uniref:hypothetical protein n=1 Tax=Cohnella fermenti TaxID=2565925 RepID=UPI001454DB48|nr:hypothetical protein [Cohnella fermenti]
MKTIDIEPVIDRLCAALPLELLQTFIEGLTREGPGISAIRQTAERHLQQRQNKQTALA